VNDLLHAYLQRRCDLDAAEAAALSELLARDGEALAWLRGQLATDELLSRFFGEERADFPNRVRFALRRQARSDRFVAQVRGVVQGRTSAPGGLGAAAAGSAGATAPRSAMALPWPGLRSGLGRGLAAALLLGAVLTAVALAGPHTRRPGPVDLAQAPAADQGGLAGTLALPPPRTGAAPPSVPTVPVAPLRATAPPDLAALPAPMRPARPLGGPSVAPVSAVADLAALAPGAPRPALAPAPAPGAAVDPSAHPGAQSRSAADGAPLVDAGARPAAGAAIRVGGGDGPRTPDATLAAAGRSTGSVADLGLPRPADAPRTASGAAIAAGSPTPPPPSQDPSRPSADGTDADLLSNDGHATLAMVPPLADHRPAGPRHRDGDSRLDGEGHVVHGQIRSLIRGGALVRLTLMHGDGAKVYEAFPDTVVRIAGLASPAGLTLLRTGDHVDLHCASTIPSLILYIDLHRSRRVLDSLRRFAEGRGADP
jgi:hypothetical protein